MVEEDSQGGLRWDGGRGDESAGVVGDELGGAGGGLEEGRDGEWSLGPVVVLIWGRIGGT